MWPLEISIDIDVWATQVEDCGEHFSCWSVFALEYSSDMSEQWSRPTLMRAVLRLASVVSCLKAGFEAQGRGRWRRGASGGLGGGRGFSVCVWLG